MTLKLTVTSFTFNHPQSCHNRLLLSLLLAGTLHLLFFWVLPIHSGVSKKINPPIEVTLIHPPKAKPLPVPLEPKQTVLIKKILPSPELFPLQKTVFMAIKSPKKILSPPIIIKPQEKRALVFTARVKIPPEIAVSQASIAPKSADVDIPNIATTLEQSKKSVIPPSESAVIPSMATTPEQFKKFVTPPTEPLVIPNIATAPEQSKNSVTPPVEPVVPMPPVLERVISEPKPPAVVTESATPIVNETLPTVLEMPRETTVAAPETVASPELVSKSPPSSKKKHKTKQQHSENIAPIAIADLEAQIAQIGEKYGKLSEVKPETPVKKISTPHRPSLLVQQYRADWQRKIERIGNLNYPQAAQTEGFSASLVMEVKISRDGSLQGMTIKKSSDYPEIDEAAKNIVQMSMPFAPFPRQLAEELDVLVIRRTWRFSNEAGMSTY